MRRAPLLFPLRLPQRRSKRAWITSRHRYHLCSETWSSCKQRRGNDDTRLFVHLLSNLRDPQGQSDAEKAPSGYFYTAKPTGLPWVYRYICFRGRIPQQPPSFSSFSQTKRGGGRRRLAVHSIFKTNAIIVYYGLLCQWPALGLVLGPILASTGQHWPSQLHYKATN